MYDKKSKSLQVIFTPPPKKKGGEVSKQTTSSLQENDRNQSKAHGALINF